MTDTGIVDGRLPDSAFRSPQTFRAVVDRKTYHDVMIREQGKVLAHGVFWNIKARNLGAGVWELTLVRATI